MFKSRFLKGFTLLELIVVIVVIGLLAGLVVPSFGKLKLSSEVRVGEANLVSFARSVAAANALERESDLSGSLNRAAQDYAPVITSAASAVTIIGSSEQSLNQGSVSAGFSNADRAFVLASMIPGKACVFVRAVGASVTASGHELDLEQPCAAAYADSVLPGDKILEETPAEPETPAEAPAQPENIRVSDITASSVAFEWDPVADATGYVPSYTTNDGTSWTSASQQPDTSYTVTGLERDTTVTLRVAAVSAGGQGPWSAKRANIGEVTTLAGSGTAGTADGTGTEAQFYNPYGVAADAAGNVYVADRDNNRIRKITPAGVVTTLAGSTQGFADGTGTEARFNWPYGIAVDAAGNVYVADSGNHRIRKITPEGVVTTLAGSTQGYADGTGTEARFRSPVGVVLDAAGNVYVADYSNHRIRKITPEGAVSTLAGSGTSGFLDGSGTAARFNYPASVAVDASGNVYVADQNNQRIRKITPEGAVSTLAGSGAKGSTDGPGTAAQFNTPMGVATDAAGNVYVGDYSNHRVRKITPEGVVTTLAGSTSGFADGTGTEAQFYTPRGVATDAAGNVYVADMSNHRIRSVAGTSDTVKTLSQ